MGLRAIDVGEGPPVVLLHGQPGTAGDWHAVTVRLRERMRVIVPDRPGYGATNGRAKGFRDNARAIAALLDRLGVESAAVVGHSWASGVALAAAIGYPARVRALVLASPVAPGVEPGAVDRLLAHPLLGPPAVRVGFKVAGLGLSLAPVRRVARRAVPELPPEQVALTAAEWRTDGVWRSFYTEQRALIAELPSLADGLRAVQKPATILYGTRDRVSSPTHARRLAALLPHARLVKADGAGHMLPQQRPELVAEAIERVDQPST